MVCLFLHLDHRNMFAIPFMGYVTALGAQGSSAAWWWWWWLKLPRGLRRRGVGRLLKQGGRTDGRTAENQTYRQTVRQTYGRTDRRLGGRMGGGRRAFLPGGGLPGGVCGGGPRDRRSTFSTIDKTNSCICRVRHRWCEPTRKEHWHPTP
jgi:hypothetical protein